jgi:hypothetical protein
MAAAARCGRNREAKRQIAGVSDDTKIIADREHAAALIADTKKELLGRLKDLGDEYERSKLSQVQTYKTKMATMSTSIKNMTQREFEALYKFDLLSKFRDVKSPKNREPAVMETPAFERRGGVQLKTPGTVRRRETLLYVE